MIRNLEYSDYEQFRDLISKWKDFNLKTYDFYDLLDLREQRRITTLVYIMDDKIVGTISGFPEPKFIHNGGQVMHSEDLFVDPEYRGLQIGSMLLRRLCSLAEQYGCYKVIADASDESVGLHTMCRFRKHDTAMRLDLNTTGGN